VSGTVHSGPVHAALSDLRTIEPFVRARLAEPLPGADAQRRFAPRPLRKGWRPELVPDDARRAAALVLIYPGAAGPSIPLTVRHADLPDHGGQVSLPGGKIDRGETAAEAALREAHEELGLDASTVRLLGPLSSFWVVVSGFVVFPFVGVTDRRPDFRPSTGEVAEVLEAPIADLLDADRRGWGDWTREGVLVRFPYVELAGHKVWGATAMMLSEFGALFDPAFAPPDGDS
jgi:8-oxo-dGTP pyrophosphatase MutT (NUDIX family)